MKDTHKEKIEISYHELGLIEMCIRDSIYSLRLIVNDFHIEEDNKLLKTLTTLVCELRERYVTAYKEGKENDVPR